MKRDYKCVAFSCDKRTPHTEVMCEYHWAMLPETLKMKIDALYCTMDDIKHNKRKLFAYTRHCREAADIVKATEEMF